MIGSGNEVAEVVVALRMEQKQYDAQLRALKTNLNQFGRAMGGIANTIGKFIVLPGLAMAGAGVRAYMKSGEAGATKMSAAWDKMKESFNDFLIRVGAAVNQGGRLTSFLEKLTRLLSGIKPGTIKMVLDFVGFMTAVFLFTKFASILAVQVKNVIALVALLKASFAAFSMKKIMAGGMLATSAPTLAGAVSAPIANMPIIAGGKAMFAGLGKSVGYIAVAIIAFKTLAKVLGRNKDGADEMATAMNKMAYATEYLFLIFDNIATFIADLLHFLSLVLQMRWPEAGDFWKESWAKKPKRPGDEDVDTGGGKFKLGSKVAFSELNDLSARVAAGGGVLSTLKKIEENTRKAEQPYYVNMSPVGV